MEDFTKKYNTSLTSKDEVSFQKWLKEESQKLNRDISHDLFDYDLRGLWKEKGGFGEDGHATDKYKKPNHPTFSKESKYNGIDGYSGGEWKEDDKGRLSFIASSTNQKFYKRKGLERYFAEREPGVSLIFEEGEQSLANQMFYPNE